MIGFYSFHFIMQGKLIILRTRCFLHQNISQLPWFKEKTLLQSKFCRTFKYLKGFKAWSAFCFKVAEKARRNNNHSNTQISHRLRNDICVGFGAKLTADEEDDNPFTIIVRMRKNQTRAQNHVSIEFLFNGCP